MRVYSLYTRFTDFREFIKYTEELLSSLASQFKPQFILVHGLAPGWMI